MHQLLLEALRRMHIITAPVEPPVEPVPLPVEDDIDDWGEIDDDALVGPLLLLYGEWDDVDDLDIGDDDWDFSDE